MVGQGAREAMAEQGAREAMAEQGAREAMAEQELGRPWRSRELGRPWQIKELGRPWWDRLRDRGPSPHPRSLRPEPYYHPPQNFLGENRGSIGHLRGAGTGGHLRGAGTGGRLRGAGTGGHLRGAALEGTCDEQALEGTCEQALEGTCEELPLGGALEAWTLGGTLESWTEPAGALESWTEPAGALESWTGPAGALESWTGPAGALESWTGPAGALEGLALEKLALEGAVEERALESYCEDEGSLGLPYSLPAGKEEPRAALAGLGEPRTTAGWFWLGPGHSPDTGGSLPSILVQWCLGGPRDDGHWPRARTERGWWRHLMPSPRQARRTPANTRWKGDLGGQGRWSGQRFPSPREPKKLETKNFSKTGKQKWGRRNAASFCFGRCSVRLSGEQGARRHGEYFNKALIKHKEDI